MAKIKKLEIKVNDGKEISFEQKLTGGKDVPFEVIAGAVDAAEKAFRRFINMAS